MRRVLRTLTTLLLPAVILAGVLGGCGGDDSAADVADEASPPPSSSPTPTPTPTPTETPSPTEESGDADWRLVEIVHATAAGGETSAKPVPVGDEAERAAFTAQFRRPELGEQIDRVVSGHTARPGMTLVATVIAIGCDVPPGVTYADGLVTPKKVAEPLQECFAAVTSVAILEIPA